MYDKRRDDNIGIVLCDIIVSFNPLKYLADKFVVDVKIVKHIYEVTSLLVQHLNWQKYQEQKPQLETKEITFHVFSKANEVYIIIGQVGFKIQNHYSAMFMAIREHITKSHYSQQQSRKERLYGTHCIDRSRHFKDSMNGAAKIEEKVHTINDDK